jgi:hypothetical protein
MVRVFTKFREISMGGIGTVTDPDGRFFIAGFQLDNTPIDAQVWYPPRDPEAVPPETLQDREVGRQWIKRDRFNEETNNYDLGSIEISSVAATKEDG